MKNRTAIFFVAAFLCVTQAPVPAAGQGTGAQTQPQSSAPQPNAPKPNQEAATDPKAKAIAEARTKRNLQMFENNATIINLYDRSGKMVGKLGERALYDGPVFSPDRKRVAVIKADKADLENESADLWVLDVGTGAATRITTSAKREFVTAVVWSADSSQLAYVTIRSGQEGIYRRAANGQGAEELLYKHTGAFVDLSDWSADGRFLAFSKTDLAGGVLYVLPLTGEREPREVFRTYKQLSGGRFSPDGRFLSYFQQEQSSFNHGEVWVRPVDATPGAGPWQISEESSSTGFWKADGKELYFVGMDRSVMATETTETKTDPSFTFTKPKALFRPAGAVPDRISNISSDGERFLARPPARGPQLQQITLFDREGKVVEKVGEPGMFSQPAFSPDSKRLVVMKNDLNSGRQDIWTIDIATGKGTQLTNDALIKFSPMWSPDGRQILYGSMRNGNWGIYRKSADGAGAEELLFEYTAGAFVGLSDISADGKFIICESGGVIMIVPLTGSDPHARKETEYLRNEFANGVGRLSPDGRFLAFRSDEVQPEKGEIYVKAFDASTGPAGDGDPKWQISKQGANAMVHWRADGKEIFFRGLNLESNDLLVMAADVSPAPTFHADTPRLLFKLPGPLGGNLGNVSRDGQRFVFAINVPAPANANADSAGLKH